MKVAVVGSRGLSINNLKEYLPENTTEIISGGARGIDSFARDYALNNKIKLIEYLPEYDKYGKSAPLVRNTAIIKQADIVIAFWDGQSHGTKFVIDKCRAYSIPIRVYIFLNGEYFPIFES